MRGLGRAALVQVAALHDLRPGRSCRRVRASRFQTARVPRRTSETAIFKTAADECRQVLAGQRRSRHHQVGRGAFEHDPPAVVARARHGPMSMIQSACAINARWCSITMSDLPELSTP